MYWPDDSVKTKPAWMSDKDWASTQNNSIEYRPLAEKWTAKDYLRPKEWGTYFKDTGQPAGGGYSNQMYRTLQPAISRTEWNTNLTDAFSNAPMTTSTANGQLTATKTLDPTSIEGYSKWGGETLGSNSPLTYNWILPQGALDFRFSQSNAPLSDMQRRSAYTYGGAYSNAAVEPSRTRFTSGAFKVPQRQTTLGAMPNFGGTTDYRTGEMYAPQLRSGEGMYTRFSGYSPNLPMASITGTMPLGFSPSTPDRFGETSFATQLQGWRDEWAQTKGKKDFNDLLNSI
jgi:hypothetical protein